MEEKPKKKFYKKWWVWVIVVFVLIIIAGSSNDNVPKTTIQPTNVPQAQAPAVPVEQPKQPTVAVRTERCKAVEMPIKYSVLEEKDRESDVKGIPIHECYILLEKVAPTASELTSLSTELGKDVENINFIMFDTQKAYTIDKRFREIMARDGNENEISNSDWAIWDEHFLARYLKANTHRRNNYLAFVSDIYKGQDDIAITN